MNFRLLDTGRVVGDGEVELEKGYAGRWDLLLLVARIVAHIVNRLDKRSKRKYYYTSSNIDG